MLVKDVKHFVVRFHEGDPRLDFHKIYVAIKKDFPKVSSKCTCGQVAVTLGDLEQGQKYTYGGFGSQLSRALNMKNSDTLN